MSNAESMWTTIHDAITGITITRELTPEEVAALPEPTEPLE